MNNQIKDFLTQLITATVLIVLSLEIVFYNMAGFWRWAMAILGWGYVLFALIALKEYFDAKREEKRKLKAQADAIVHESETSTNTEER